MRHPALLPNVNAPRLADEVDIAFIDLVHRGSGAVKRGSDKGPRAASQGRGGYGILTGTLNTKQTAAADPKLPHHLVDIPAVTFGQNALGGGGRRST
jgi:hypothetical protein